jgi:hypothetical protein
MAFDWTSLLGAATGVAGTTFGGPLGSIVGSLAPGAFQALGSAFGLSDSTGGSSPVSQGVTDLAKIQQAASYNAAGQEGAAAGRQAGQKAAELINTQSADARLAQMQQQALATRALEGAQQSTDLGRTMAAQNLGNQRRSLMEQAAAGGASAAALANIAGNLGQSNTQALTSLASQGAQATAQGTQQAGQAFQAAEQARIADMQNRLQMFQPYAVQKFGGTTGGNLAGVGGYQQTMGQISAAEDPNALLKALGGQATGSNFGWLTMMARDPYMANLARTGRLSGNEEKISLFGNTLF